MGNKVGRNDPCPCGSGKKYKRCHPGEYDSHAALERSLPEWPVTIALVSDDFEDSGLATVFIVRENPENGRLAIAVFLCDTFCLGVKNVIFETNTSESRFEFLLEAQLQDFAPIDYADARDLILGAVHYAESLGFDMQPAAAPDYKRAKAIIEADKPFNATAFSYGRNGRPFYITGPNDDYAKVFATLEQSCGKGGFDYEIDERVPYVYRPGLIDGIDG